MHELSLAQGLLDQLKSLADEHKKTKVLSLTMEIGPFAGVVIDSFKFGFDIISKQEPLTEDAELKIICPPASYRCCGCGQLIKEEQRPDTCPDCSETIFSPVGSDDLMLLQVEME